MLRELSDAEYRATFGTKMIEVKAEHLNLNDIWVYAHELVKKGVIFNSVYTKKLIEIAYQNQENTFTHVLLPGDDKHLFIVIISNLRKDEIYGHYFLDLNEKYALN